MYKKIIYLCLIAVLISTIVFVGEEFNRHIDSIEDWIKSFGFWAFLVFIVIYIVLSLIFVPDTLLGIISGAIFGLTLGVFCAVVGSTLVAILQFFVSHRLLKARIQNAINVKPKFLAIQQVVAHNEFKLQLLIRLTPLNRAITNYVLSVANITFSKYLLACIGFLPHIVLEVYLGQSGKELIKNIHQTEKTAWLENGTIVFGIVAAIIAMFTITRIASRSLHTASLSDTVDTPSS